MATNKLVQAALNQLNAAITDSALPEATSARLAAIAKSTASKIAATKSSSKALVTAIEAAASQMSTIAVDDAEAAARAFQAIQAIVGIGQLSSGDPRLSRFGWVRDIPDPRDQTYSASLATLKNLPPSVDLRAAMPPVYNQGDIGSCTANAIGACVQHVRRRGAAMPDFPPSRLFIYYNEREIENSIPLDNGAQLRDGMKSLSKLGVCPEDYWPYDSQRADPLTHLFPAGARAVRRPDNSAYGMALQHIAISYWSIAQTLSQLKSCLVEGFPFVFGFLVFESFYDANLAPKTRIPLPSAMDVSMGGHAVVAVGYDDSRNEFIVRNSWGDGVQDSGHFYMPYSYVTDIQLAADFWTLRAVSG